jgi:signal peptidase I
MGNPGPLPVSSFMAAARKEVWDRFNIIYRPVDRRDNYVKRCIAIPGDTLFIRKGEVFVNGEAVPANESQQFNYLVTTNGTTINPLTFERLGIYRSDQTMFSGSLYSLPLTKGNAEIISRFANVREVKPYLSAPGVYNPVIFPHSRSFSWNEDYFGPLWIPARGATVAIDTSNLCLYERIIDVYEDNDLRVEGKDIFINGQPAQSYTFKMDYYFMMGDNRHNSADSRYWGFVPLDHIVGKPKFIWLSIDKEASGIRKIRFKRIFKKIR